MDLTRHLRCAIVSMGLTAALGAIGCHSAPSMSESMATASHIDVRPGFVMPSEELSELERRDPNRVVRWEASRNNPAIQPHVAAVPDYGGFKMIEVRHRENLRTISGRPREHSSSRTRIWERRGVPRRGIFRR